MTTLNDDIRYEPDEHCSAWVALGVGAQGVLLMLPIVVLIAVITVLAAHEDEQFMAWTVFAALVISGAVTTLQSSRFGRLGGAHILITAVTPVYIAVSVLALEEGGPPLLATLIVLSGIFYLAIAAWLPLVRRIVTPVVSGTILILIAIMVLPISLDRLGEVPESAAEASGPVTALATLAAMTVFAIRARGVWKLWSMPLGIVVGCLVAIPLGLFDLQHLRHAPWIGIPVGGFPGLDLTPSAGAWALLPMFLIVTLVQAIKHIGDSMLVQQVSWRKSRAIDFRLVQGAISANGVGMLLSGIAGTPPTAFAASQTASIINFTGVAARRVGYFMGGLFAALALFPKVTGFFAALPRPVMGAFLMLAIGMMLVEGIRTIAQVGLDAKSAVLVGLALAVGVGLQGQNIVAEILGHPWGTLLGNGMTIGTAVAVGVSAFMEFTGPRRRRLEAKLDVTELPRIDAFLQEVAREINWDLASTQRLRSAGEETLSSLLQSGDEQPDGDAPRLIIGTRPDEGIVEMEFLAVFEEDNLEDRLTYLEEQAETADDRELSFRLLRHYASSVRHQKYHGLDIVKVTVEGS